ncbi:multiple epidermal growth factor-like domains protein 10 isoform X2 [Cloeon dipterum]|uniref:multiple epidermal growth factor-like domains protein 10 isoform X2 n=1 Tax=Cloeon dipterum TaxID=197152 RepID=UPI00321FE2BA
MENATAHEKQFFRCQRPDAEDTLVGWEGLLCDRPCRRGFWGTKCSNECPCEVGQGECDPVTGDCQCLTGFMLQKCELPCNMLKYGFNCNKPCECTKNADGCDPVTGRCLCQEGWHGWICDSRCEDGFWGIDCNQTCNCGQGNVPCRHSNGKCHCPAGTLPGSDGHCTYKCPEGTYGYGCEESCAKWQNRNLTGAQILAKGTCDPVTGDLICLPGYEGVNCKNSCPNGKFGLNCSSDCACLNGECHHVTGECRCHKEWRGTTCEERCPRGTYGYNCTLNCTINCLNEGFCLRYDKCGCEDGWAGDDCALVELSFFQDLQRGFVFLALLATVVILSLLLLFILQFSRTEQVFEYEITQTSDSDSVNRSYVHSN